MQPGTKIAWMGTDNLPMQTDYTQTDHITAWACIDWPRPRLDYPTGSGKGGYQLLPNLVF